MSYQSKYTVVLMVENKKIKEKELEMAALVQERTNILKRIEKEEANHVLFRSFLSKKQSVDGLYLMGSADYEYEKKLKMNLQEVDEKLKNERLNYQKLKEKKKVIEEMDQKEEKHYYETIRRKEQKKIIGMKTMLTKNDRDGGET